MKDGLQRQRIAMKRIEALLEQARIRPSFAKRYVALARRMASRHKVRVPVEWRRRICKACDALLVPGKNAIVRIRNGVRVMTCLDCKNVKRLVVKR